jgi:hypothetical protein
MKRFLFVSGLLLLLSAQSTAQKINITGSVKDVHDHAIPLASITTGKSKTGVAADGNGNFSLSVLPNTAIYISALGFKDTVINVQATTHLQIVLQPAENYLSNVQVTASQNKFTPQFSNQLKNEIVQAEFLHYKMENNISSSGISVYEGNRIVGNSIVSYHITTNAPSGNIYQGSALPEFHSKEDTKGSIYLFDSWMQGTVVNGYDSNIVNDDKNLYNINKITGDLVMTRDFRRALTLDKTRISFFTLFDSSKNAHTFMTVPEINIDLFCEVIALGDSCAVFKLTTTKFVKANFQSDGIVSTGNNYDEYVDDVKYYVYNGRTDAYQPFLLKKKSIIAAFDNNARVNEYFSKHKDAIDENVVKNLADYINGETKPTDN